MSPYQLSFFKVLVFFCLHFSGQKKEKGREFRKVGETEPGGAF